MAPRFSRSVDLGKLIGTTFSTWIRNLVPFTFLALIVMSPMAVADYWVSTLGSDERGFPPIGPRLLAMLLPYALMPVLSGALTYGVVQQLRKQPAGFGPSLAQGLRALPAVIGTSFLVWIRCFLFSLLLVIPGIMEAFRLFVAIPATVMERGGVGNSIQRSIALTDGSRWQLFACTVVISMASAVPIFVASFMIVLSSGLEAEMPWWFNTVAQIAVGPLSATVGAVAYFQLRMLKENVDVDQIAAVFD